MTTKKKDKIAGEIRSDLFSSDEAIVLRAIHRCRDEGNATLVEPLIAFYASDGNVDMKKEVGEMLSTLKVSNVEQYFLDALKNPDMKHIRRDIIMFMWSSDLRPVENLSQITSIALEGNLEETLECLTLLESLEMPVPEEIILENITLIKQNNNSNASPAVKNLIHTYLGVLENMRFQSDMD